MVYCTDGLGFVIHLETKGDAIMCPKRRSDGKPAGLALMMSKSKRTVALHHAGSTFPTSKENPIVTSLIFDNGISLTLDGYYVLSYKEGDLNQLV